LAKLKIKNLGGFLIAKKVMSKKEKRKSSDFYIWFSLSM